MGIIRCLLISLSKRAIRSECQLAVEAPLRTSIRVICTSAQVTARSAGPSGPRRPGTATRTVERKTMALSGCRTSYCWPSESEILKGWNGLARSSWRTSSGLIRNLRGIIPVPRSPAIDGKPHRHPNSITPRRDVNAAGDVRHGRLTKRQASPPANHSCPKQYILVRSNIGSTRATAEA